MDVWVWDVVWTVVCAVFWLLVDTSGTWTRFICWTGKFWGFNSVDSVVLEVDEVWTLVWVEPPWLLEFYEVVEVGVLTMGMGTKTGWIDWMVWVEAVLELDDPLFWVVVKVCAWFCFWITSGVATGLTLTSLASVGWFCCWETLTEIVGVIWTLLLTCWLFTITLLDVVVEVDVEVEVEGEVVGWTGKGGVCGRGSTWGRGVTLIGGDGVAKLGWTFCTGTLWPEEVCYVVVFVDPVVVCLLSTDFEL